MKTADLIPFILLELNECDKYGFELTKAIEAKSQGKIIIKQPTLYTLLKKLEKSKFIASYWEDSEIGGKRHYYKLTENGRLQVSTLPSYEFLLKNALGEDIEISNETTTEVARRVEPENRVSIMDELLATNTTLAETVLPSNEVFIETNFDNSTELEINVANTEILKDSSTIIDENFASNEDVSRFTEKVESSQIFNEEEKIVEEHKIDASLNSDCDIFDVNFTIPKNETEIKYVDYVDHKNSDSYKTSKRVSSKMLLQSLSTSATLILAVLLSSVVSSFTGRSALYYAFFISAILVAIFYPIIIATNTQKIRLKVQSNQFDSKIKQRLYIGASLFLLIVIICIVVNIKMNNNTISLILGFKNFENLYAPLLMSSIYFIDLLYNHLFMSKINK